MRIPAWRHWFCSSVMVALFGGVYWTFLSIIGLAPMIESNLKWALLGFGIFLSLASCYALARGEEKSEAVELRAAGAEGHANASIEIAKAALEILASKPTQDLQAERFEELKQEITRLRELQGDVFVRPGTGELKVTGYAPTVVVAPSPQLEQELREQEARVLKQVVALRGTIVFPLTARATGKLTMRTSPSEPHSGEPPLPKSDA